MSSITRATAFSSFMVIIATDIKWLMGDLIDYSDLYRFSVGWWRLDGAGLFLVY
jgi:hypothetical protein